MDTRSAAISRRLYDASRGRRLLASMKSDSGRVTIDGFYDDAAPLNAAERKAVAEAPDIDRELMRELWLGSAEGDGLSLTELITLPSLNIRGMASARVGADASNVIPATATASIDIRLVKGMNPQRTGDRVVAHIRRQGFFVVDKPATPEIRLAHARVIWVDRERRNPLQRLVRPQFTHRAVPRVHLADVPSNMG